MFESVKKSWTNFEKVIDQELRMKWLLSIFVITKHITLFLIYYKFFEKNVQKYIHFAAIIIYYIWYNYMSAFSENINLCCTLENCSHQSLLKEKSLWLSNDQIDKSLKFISGSTISVKLLYSISTLYKGDFNW